MPFDLNTGRCDPKKIADGVWWKIHLNPDRTFGGEPLKGEPGAEPSLLIRPADVEFLRAREAAERPFRLEKAAGKLSAADERQILAETIGKALWRGAANITVGGVPFEWSEGRAASMLSLPDWWNLADFVLAAAHSRQALIAEEEAEASGN